MLRLKKREHPGPGPQASHPTDLQEAQLWPTLGCWVVQSYATKVPPIFFFGKVSLDLNNNGREYDRICFFIFLFYILFYLQGCISHFKYILTPNVWLLVFVGLLQPILFQGKEGAAVINIRVRYILTIAKNIWCRENSWNFKIRTRIILVFNHLQVLISPSVKLRKCNAWFGCAVASLGLYIGKEPRGIAIMSNMGSESIEANNVFAWICVK